MGHRGDRGRGGLADGSTKLRSVREIHSHGLDPERDACTTPRDSGLRACSRAERKRARTMSQVRWSMHLRSATYAKDTQLTWLCHLCLDVHLPISPCPMSRALRVYRPCFMLPTFITRFDATVRPPSSVLTDPNDDPHRRPSTPSPHTRPTPSPSSPTHHPPYSSPYYRST